LDDREYDRSLGNKVIPAIRNNYTLAMPETGLVAWPGTMMVTRYIIRTDSRQKDTLFVKLPFDLAGIE
jgi:hypothetical protein